jgi:hypothetical protein
MLVIITFHRGNMNYEGDQDRWKRLVAGPAAQNCWFAASEHYGHTQCAGYHRNSWYYMAGRLLSCVARNELLLDPT